VLERLVHRLMRLRGRGSHSHGHAASTEHDSHGDGRFAGAEAERYERQARSRVRSFRRTARELAALAPESGHVLDVGTGPGVLLLELLRERPNLRATGVDVEPAMVERARHAAAAAGLGDRLSFLESDVRSLPLEAGSVDLAAATMTAHHWPDLAAGVRELVRVVRPGGALLLVDFRREIDGPLRGALAEVAPGARVERSRRWMWGMPVLARWIVRLP